MPPIKSVRPSFLLTFAALLVAPPLFSKAATPDNYQGSDNGLWSDPNNWSAGVPNNFPGQSFDPILPSSLAVVLDIPATIDTLALTAPGTLTLQPNITLTLANGSINNAGTIFLNAFSQLYFTNDTLLSGAGSITLNSPSSLIDGLLNTRLTSSTLITGQGTINNGHLQLINNGTITATTGLLAITAMTGSSFTNTGTLRHDGGTLLLSSSASTATATITNSGGLIEAMPDSVVQLQNLIVLSGGSITIHAGGILSSSQARFVNLSNMVIANSGKMILNNSMFTWISGSIINTGTIQGSLSTIVCTGDTVLSGGGVFNTEVNGGNLSGSAGRLTTDNTIRGSGIFQGPLTNSGTITASGGTLALSTGSGSSAFLSRNTGLLSADINATLYLSEINLDNTGGVIESEPGSVVNIEIAHITGGILRGLPGSFFNLAKFLGGGQILEGTSLEGQFVARPADSSSQGVLTLEGTNTNSGTITLAGTGPNVGILVATSSTNTPFMLINTGVISSPRFAETRSVPFQLTGGGTLNSASVGMSNFTTDNFITTSVLNTNTLANSGTIIDTVSGTLMGNTTNTGLIRAAGGLLSMGAVFGGPNVTITNTSGNIEVTAGGTLALYSPVIGGTLSASSGGMINFQGALSAAPPILLSNGSILINSFNSTQLNTVSGPGTLTINAPTASNAINITAVIIDESLTILAGSGTSKFSDLQMAHTNTGSSAKYTSMLQLNNNHLILQSTDPTDKSAKILALNEALFAGHNGTTQTWSSTQGITSATVAADPQHLTIGIYDNAALHSLTNSSAPRTDWAGGTNNVDTNSILITPALKGDANLDGIIDIADMVVIANNWNKSGLVNGISTIDMAHGDLNQDGVVDIADMVVIANNWNQTSPFNLSPDPTQNSDFHTQVSPASAPEPFSIVLLSLSAAILLRRRSTR